MPVTPTYPGVYVQEVPSGVRTIAGVSTSIAMFIGASKKGPMFQPVRCTNYTDFVRAFSADTSAGQLPNYLKLFFLNGGTDCYVMRIANGATPSTVTLKNEKGVAVLDLTAKDEGLAGENIRAVVSYNTPQPEVTFNVDLFRWTIDSAGNRTKNDAESWKGLTMDPASPLFAPSFISQNSKLVSALSSNPSAVPGFSISGRAVDMLPGDPTFQAAWKTLFGKSTPNTSFFLISVNGSPYATVDLSNIAVATQTQVQTTADVKAAIESSLAASIPGVTVTVTFPAYPATSTFTRMKIESSTGDVFIRPAAQNDLAVPLMLGTAQGGIEVSGRALHRPAPNGITFRGYDPDALNAFGNLAQTDLTNITLDAIKPDGTFGASPAISMATLKTVNTSGAKMMVDATQATTSPNGRSDGVREKFAIIAQRINEAAASSAGTIRWKAEVWGSRLAILPTNVGDNFVSANFVTTQAASTTLVKDLCGNNVNVYSVGHGGTPNGQQSPAPSVASDATKTWDNAQKATTGVGALRIGLAKDYSAVFFPRITIDDGGLKKNIGPAGAIAGLCARTDGTRGVWKAPAGTDADLRGVIGLEQRFSDGENGILNPRAVNTIRIFPNGIVNWGARTMDGDNDFGSEYKYIPIRRLALYMEESLYRGLKWVVFEPNDEPLWAQIRLNVGAFMHNLFRQGAFQGTTPKDAYFVKCDKETTTQNDRNLGIVNIWVGFAPLKPAEFVILYLQQMAGQIEV